MSREIKGFSVALPSYSRLGHSGKTVNRSISFQLTETGVRYFFVDDRSGWQDVGGRVLRDISTQYRSMTRSGYGYMWMGDLETKKTHERLIAHARKFYPEFTIPEFGFNDPYPWVAFPMIGAAMKGSHRTAPYGVNLQIASGLRAFSVREMTETIFGEAPRNLQAAVAGSLKKSDKLVNIDNLTLASLLRGYLPPNQMVDVLSMDLRDEGWIQQTDYRSANNIRLLLRRFSPQRLLRLILSIAEQPTHGYMLLRDSGNQYAQARKDHPNVVMDLSRQFRNLQELHESITREYRKLVNANQEISYDERLSSSLDEITLPDGAKLIRPSCTHELMDWASDASMNNCIYSYGKDAANGRCLLLGVLDSSGKMIINIEIRGRNILQCYGKSNQTVTDEPLLEALFKGLIDANIINPENNHIDWTRRNRGLW